LDNIQIGIRFEPIPGEKPLLAGTKFGGLPDAPPDFNWPRHPNTVPYLFLMQVNLTEVHRILPDNPLPNEGILSFFTYYVNNEAKVYHFKDPDALRPAEVPVFKQKRSIWHRIFSFRHSFELFGAHKMRLEKDYSIPNIGSLHLHRISLELGHDLSSSMLSESDHVDLLYPECDDPKHQLLGHYQSHQEEVYELELVDGPSKRFDKLSTADLDQVLEWVLLLKIADDPRLNFTWMDAGCVLFFIHHKDLENGDFSKVRVVYDSA
jgi:uncharacterized protein YwqG